MLDQFINRLTGKSSEKTSDPTADKLRAMLAVADMGSKEDGLAYVQIATASNATEAESLLTALRLHSWESLCKIDDWKSESDAVTAYAVASPAKGGVVMVVKSPYELYAGDELWRVENISPEDMTTIGRCLPAAQWKPI